METTWWQSSRKKKFTEKQHLTRLLSQFMSLLTTLNPSLYKVFLHKNFVQTFFFPPLKLSCSTNQSKNQMLSLSLSVQVHSYWSNVFTISILVYTFHEDHQVLKKQWRPCLVQRDQSLSEYFGCWWLHYRFVKVLWPDMDLFLDIMA